MSAMVASTKSFRSGSLCLDLYPDSRGYVLFSLWKQDDQNPTVPRLSITRMTSEYLVDVLQVTIEACKWIEANCENVTHEGRHLYFAFKEQVDALVYAEEKNV